ncbi:MAG: hypothetical protein RMJ53_00710 [Chitinophagales bacterium]|nr:hypothetical protein [Chitinophagales bacterium]MDW8272731.1 hypothetical protein [Chitinophagales bacterium]
MCLHAQSANDLIQFLMKVVYPSVQYHFLEVVWKGNFLPEEKSNGVDHILSDLKSEFNSLYTYETKLVFPAVLRTFDKNIQYRVTNTPDIYELVDLTRRKENRMRTLIDELKKHVLPESEKNQSIEKLIDSFETEFFPAKEDWNDMINNRLSTCSCFKKAIKSQPSESNNEFNS